MNNDDNRIPTQDDHDPYFEGNDDSMVHPEQEPRLAEDGATPAAPARDVAGAQIPIDYPQTDTNVDPDELYQEGSGIASGTNVQHENTDLEERIVDEDDEDRNARLR